MTEYCLEESRPYPHSHVPILPILLIHACLLACCSCGTKARTSEELLEELGRSKTSSARALAELFARNKKELPKWLRLEHADTQYDVSRVRISSDIEIVECGVVCPVNMAFLKGMRRRVFLFNLEGVLLLQTDCGTMLFDRGFADLTGNRVKEKVACATYRPDVPPGTFDLKKIRDKELRVFALVDGKWRCVFRVLFSSFWGDDFVGPAPALIDRDQNGLQEIVFEYWPMKGNTETIAVFEWDKERKAFVGRAGGQGEPWQVAPVD